jgi:hypothetical protein
MFCNRCGLALALPFPFSLPLLLSLPFQACALLYALAFVLSFAVPLTLASEACPTLVDRTVFGFPTFWRTSDMVRDTTIKGDDGKAVVTALEGLRRCGAGRRGRNNRRKRELTARRAHLENVRARHKDFGLDGWRQESCVNGLCVKRAVVSLTLLRYYSTANDPF